MSVGGKAAYTVKKFWLLPTSHQKGHTFQILDWGERGNESVVL